MSPTLPTIRRDESTHLSWDGKSGLARHQGTSRILTEPPKLSTIHLVVGLNYTPAVHLAEVRESAGPFRPMSPGELDEIRALLDSMAAAAAGVFLKNANVSAIDRLAEPGEPCIGAWSRLCDAMDQLREPRQNLVTCLHRHGLSYEEIAALLQRLRAEGEAVIGMALASARNHQPAEPATP